MLLFDSCSQAFSGSEDVVMELLRTDGIEADLADHLGYRLIIFQLLTLFLSY
jgi:hypothetical protein